MWGQFCPQIPPHVSRPSLLPRRLRSERGGLGSDPPASCVSGPGCGACPPPGGGSPWGPALGRGGPARGAGAGLGGRGGPRHRPHEPPRPRRPRSLRDRPGARRGPLAAVRRRPAPRGPARLVAAASPALSLLRRAPREAEPGGWRRGGVLGDAGSDLWTQAQASGVGCRRPRACGTWSSDAPGGRGPNRGRSPGLATWSRGLVRGRAGRWLVEPQGAPLGRVTLRGPRPRALAAGPFPVRGRCPAPTVQDSGLQGWPLGVPSAPSRSKALSPLSSPWRRLSFRIPHPLPPTETGRTESGMKRREG